MTAPYVPGPAFSTAPNAAEIAALARIIMDSSNEALTVNALNRYWGGLYEPAAIRAALKLADHDRSQHRGTIHSPRLRGQGVAARAVQRSELFYRSAYLANATRRIDAKLKAGAGPREATAAERTYYAAHELARRGRQRAAMAVDNAADAYGDVLGWHTHADDRTTPECLAANGSNFRADMPPAIGYPGAVHIHCRCTPGPPFRNNRTVDQVTAGIRH